MTIAPHPATPWWAVTLLIVLSIAIPALCGVVTALITRPMRAQITAAAADAKVARDHVANSHTTNLRDDWDAKHDETITSLDRLTEAVADLQSSSREQRRDIGGLREENRLDRRDFSALTERVTAIDAEQRKRDQQIAAQIAALSAPPPPTEPPDEPRQ